jgi:hypothetical protein
MGVHESDNLVEILVGSAQAGRIPMSVWSGRWVNSADACGACAAIGGNHCAAGRTLVYPDELGHGKRRGYLTVSGQFR